MNKEYRIIKTKIREDYVFYDLDDGELMISIDAYLDHKMKDRQIIPEDLYLILKEDEKLLKAYRSCLRKLAMKDQSIAQIHDFLLKKELSEKECQQIISRLENYGLLDDEKYAQNKIAYYDRNNLSARRIENKLLNEGISRSLISCYLKIDPQREQAKAKQLAERYVNAYKNSSSKAHKQKVMNKLISDGFTYEIVRTVADSLNFHNENELELLEKEYHKAYSHYSRKYADYDLKKRIYASLLSKGFAGDDIRKVMENSDE